MKKYKKLSVLFLLFAVLFLNSCADTSSRFNQRLELTSNSIEDGMNKAADIKKPNTETFFQNGESGAEDNNGQNGTNLPMDVRSLQSYIESRDREVSKRPQEYEITFEQAEKITTGMTFKEVVSIIGKGQLRPIPFSFNWHPAALYSWEICDEKGKTLFVSFDYTKEDFAELIQLSRDLFGDSEGSIDLNTYISTWESEEMTEFISDHLTVHGCSIRENDQSSQLTTEP